MDKKCNHCVAGIITNEKGEILLERHVKTQAYTLPGGKIDNHETPKLALVRELFEELGILAYRYELIIENKFNQIEYPVGSGNYSDFYQNYFSIDEYKGEITNKEPEKHPELLWMKPEEIRDYLPKISAVLNYYLEKIGL